MNERISIMNQRPKVKSQNRHPQIQRKKNHSKTKNSPVDRILFLQRTAGNQAVQRLIKSGALQAKLRIGQPGDTYEQEADRVAEQVMRMPEPQAVSSGTPYIHSIQRACIRSEDEVLSRQPIEEKKEELRRQPIEEEEEELQAKATSVGISEVNPDIESHIQNMRGGGQPLPESARAYFEPRFGHDFSQVRVHTDAKAAESSRVVNARAFTVGQDVVFGAGQYAPGTTTGQRLLAHELTHVVQQRNIHPTAVPSPNGSVNISLLSGALPMIAKQIDVEETVAGLEEENKSPKDLMASEAADIGEEVLGRVGYEEIINLALEAGFIKRKETNQGGGTVQQQLMPLKNTIFREAATATFGAVFVRYAITAGIVSQLDTPAPGPADVVALGILVVGLAAAGYAVHIASHGRGNVADTGIMTEVRNLIEAAIAAGTTLTVCQALAQLLVVAQRNRDAQKIRKIDRTQKAHGCRHHR